MPRTSESMPRGVMYRSLNSMCADERSWADVQRYFRRNCEVCTDGGYFESLMMLWKHYGEPGRLRFFRKALSARYWNPLLIMGTAEYSKYERLPSTIWSRSTRPGTRGWVQFVEIDETAVLQLQDARADGVVRIDKVDVFAVQIHHGRNTFLVLNPPEVNLARAAIGSQRKPFTSQHARAA